MNDKLVETFLEEARELLDGLEDHLLDLEKDPRDVEAMNAAFRALHSIKGSASMFGYDAAGAFAHEVEAALDYFRGNKLPATPTLTDAVLRSRDYLRALLDAPETASDAERDELKAIMKDVVAGSSALPAKKKSPGGASKAIAPISTEGDTHTFHISYAPSKDAYQRGVKPESLVKELKALGKTSVRSICNGIPSLSELDPEQCFLAWEVLLTTSRSEADVREVFIFEEGVSEYSIEELDPDDYMDGDEVKRLGEILASKHFDDSRIKEALSKQRPIGEILVTELDTPPKVIEDALFEQQHARNVTQAAREDVDKKTIRIRSEKLDGLLNLVGELVTVQAQLSQDRKSVV